MPCLPVEMQFFLWFPEQNFVKQTFEKEKGILYYDFDICDAFNRMSLSVYFCVTGYTSVEWDDSLFCHINIKQLSV